MIPFAYPERLKMAPVRRKSLVSFGWSELTFVERPEYELLTDAVL
jgi:hypothetical protein